MTDPTYEPGQSDAALRTRVRAALAAREPRQAPPFERLWRASTEPARNVAAWRPARRAVLAAVTLGPLAVLAYFSFATRSAPVNEPTADADYRLASELAERVSAPSPLDALGGTVPPPVTRGLPVISDAREPLLPKEIML